MIDERIYLVEAVAAVDAAGTLATQRWTTASMGYATGPADSPANVVYDPCVKQVGYIERAVSVGASRTGYGELTLATDGHLDGLLEYGFDGQAVTIRSGPPMGVYPAAYAVRLRAMAEQPEFAGMTLRLRLRDRLAELERPLQTARYGGTNALPAGTDGTADDIKGQPKPRVYGAVKNVAPVLVNTARLIYQVSDGALAAVDAVYDRGAALTAGAAYSSESDLQSNAPAAGQYRVWLAGGLVRLGSLPSGQVTVDASEGASAAARRAGALLSRIAQQMGLTAGEVSAADVAALDAAAAYELGAVVQGDETALAVMDRVALSVGAWYGFDRLGVLRLGRLVAPSGTPATDLTEISITGLERIAQDALPAWRVVLGWGRNETVQTDDVAGSVTAARRAWLAESARTATAEDATVKNRYKLAGELRRETLLTTQANAEAEAARLLALYKVRRDTFKVRARLSAEEVEEIDLGQVVRLTWGRYGLSAGRLFVVTGLRQDFERDAVEMTLWG